MNIPVIAALVILIVILVFLLWRKPSPLPDNFTLPLQLLLTWLVIALLRLLSLPV